MPDTGLDYNFNIRDSLDLILSKGMITGIYIIFA